VVVVLIIRRKRRNASRGNEQETKQSQNDLQLTENPAKTQYASFSEIGNASLQSSNNNPQPVYANTEQFSTSASFRKEPQSVYANTEHISRTNSLAPVYANSDVVRKSNQSNSSSNQSVYANTEQIKFN